MKTCVYHMTRRRLVTIIDRLKKSNVPATQENIIEQVRRESNPLWPISKIIVENGPDFVDA